MISVSASLADIGNRITELSKAIVWMHSDMKVVQQLLVEDDHSTHDALTRDGSSMLGKYIIGAKNNFRGFSSRQEDKRASRQVTVHHGEEDTEKEKVKVNSNAEELELQVDRGEERGEEEFSHCVAVKMEEGQVKTKPPAVTQADGGEPDEADGFTLREKTVAASHFDHVEDEAKAEVDWAEAEQRRGEDMFSGARGGDKHTEGDSEEARSSGENADTRTVLCKIKDIELHDKTERVEVKWRKGRKLEPHITEKMDVREEKVEAKKHIPSPTGSNSSQDTGFGSQEGEGSIDGILVMP